MNHEWPVLMLFPSGELALLGFVLAVTAVWVLTPRLGRRFGRVRRTPSRHGSPATPDRRAR